MLKIPKCAKTALQALVDLCLPSPSIQIHKFLHEAERTLQFKSLNYSAFIGGGITLKELGDTRIDMPLNEQQKQQVTMHNATVKENREILKDLTRWEKFVSISG